MTERFQNNEGNIVIYSDENRTQYISDRGRGQRAKRTLRLITGAPEDKQIEEAPFFIIPDDFFDWLIFRFMTDKKILDEDENLILNQISGFKGQGLEKQATLSGNGNEIMNLFSSMAFLLESDELTEIEINLTKSGETYVIRFYSKNSQIDTNFSQYTGIEMFNIDEKDRHARILLNIFIDIISSVEIAFNNDIEDDEWNKEIREGLKETIAQSIMDRLEGFK